MQTEIRFLLDLVLNHKLPAEAKKLCLERIGEVEASLIPPPRHLSVSTAQAPSTQRALDAQIQTTAPTAPPIINRVVGGEIQTGNGTRGPRKF